ncbi:hypothetical protein TOPH_07775 [Tolypocladium ophioglossoides CBS 100239]|uniref:Uncharacterized protein n=1 Tax=Tolypocladium ophioglossoides (strain CBS 100239) TaxID=1163406 RepID=A0A0L0N0N9_TOLOC|nr:hypothetical protein TOPH_07775 [Tolypocladium ophioglossoides CBS 100239]
MSPYTSHGSYVSHNFECTSIPIDPALTTCHQGESDASSEVPGAFGPNQSACSLEAVRDGLHGYELDCAELDCATNDPSLATADGEKRCQIGIETSRQLSPGDECLGNRLPYFRTSDCRHGSTIRSDDASSGVLAGQTAHLDHCREEHADAWQPPRKRRRVEPSTIPLPSPPASTSTEHDTDDVSKIAEFEEWALENVLLKRIIVDSVATVQLQFDWNFGPDGQARKDSVVNVRLAFLVEGHNSGLSWASAQLVLILPREVSNKHFLTSQRSPGLETGLCPLRHVLECCASERSGKEDNTTSGSPDATVLVIGHDKSLHQDDAAETRCDKDNRPVFTCAAIRFFWTKCDGWNMSAGQLHVNIRAGPTLLGSMCRSESQFTSGVLPSLSFQIQVSGDFVSRVQALNGNDVDVGISPIEYEFELDTGLLGGLEGHERSTDLEFTARSEGVGRMRRREVGNPMNAEREFVETAIVSRRLGGDGGATSGFPGQSVLPFNFIFRLEGAGKGLLKNHDPNKVHPRFLRAELRLSRINILHRLTHISSFDPYLRGWHNYGSLFRDILA